MIRWLLYALLGYWALQSDPFGFSAATDKALASQLGRLASFVAPQPMAPITVVAIDYASIEGLHNGGQGWMTANDWPLTYADHRRILRDLSAPRGEQAPAAIFYDIFFERPRVVSGALEPLGRQLRQLQDDPARSQVILAGGGSFIPMSQAAYDGLQQPRLAVSAWDGMGDFYPLRTNLGNDSAEHFSAAAALYQVLCETRGQDCSWLKQEDLGNLAVQWPLLRDGDCDHRWLNVGRDLWAGIGRVVGFDTGTSTYSAACLPIHQVRLAELYGEHPASLRPPGLAPGEPYAVLVGVVMPSLRDYVPSPLFGQVAGVYLHASALENLLRDDADYLHEADLKWVAVLAMGVIIGGFMFAFAQRRRHPLLERLFASAEEDLPLGRRLLRTLRFGSVFGLCVGTCYAIFVLKFKATPEGWLSLIGLMPFLLEVVLEGERKHTAKENPSNETEDFGCQPAAGGIEPGTGAG
ncbi:CHASE2 domain-containing protein [Pseudomonas sp. CAN2814]|uniref:CHASE2 domain-containing protein n=1 Tax=Pseudomonas sp. CAN1 TaxID=3046726 RepID=UPI002647D48C|nr:CHASE2 domain-containing protein [Pseudomonas sp. CAN1]MDN6855034.1 CHASE2 domain-containing protein [Pseudomonas sp. CAN1]